MPFSFPENGPTKNKTLKPINREWFMNSLMRVNERYFTRINYPPIKTISRKTFDSLQSIKLTCIKICIQKYLKIKTSSFRDRE